MGKQEAPPPPAPPDYAAANREAIQTDIETLPQRRLVESQARLGQGQFAGMGDADLAHAMQMQQIADAPEAAAALLKLQQDYGSQFAAESRKQLEAVDPTGYALRDQFGERLKTGGNTNEDMVGHLDTPTYERVGDYNFRANDPNAPQLQRVNEGTLPGLQRVGQLDVADRGMTAAGRADLERGIFDELSQVGQSDPALQRAAEQAARARGSNNGNILGDSSALNESLAVQLAQRGLDDRRRGSALDLLNSGQSTSDTANRLSSERYGANLQATAANNQAAQQEFSNRMGVVGVNNATAQQGFQNQMGLANNQRNDAQNAFQNAMAAVNQRNQATQNTFASQQAVAGQKMGARQQDIANIQSFLGLQPVVSQGAQLSGLQQGAAPFAQSQYNGANINNNAGQLGGEWAGQLYGAQTGINAAQQQAAAASNAGQQQAGATLASAAIVAMAMNCKVAREVYGEASNEWRIFRVWLLNRSSARRQSRYRSNGAGIASFLSRRGDWKNRVRLWMDGKIAEQRAVWSGAYGTA
jgi:hypothetical protein